MVPTSILDNLWLLELIRALIFVGSFVFATSYLIPKGILAFSEWMRTKEHRKLLMGINFTAGGLFILLYFLATFVVSQALPV